MFWMTLLCRKNTYCPAWCWDQEAEEFRTGEKKTKQVREKQAEEAEQRVLGEDSILG